MTRPVTQQKMSASERRRHRNDAPSVSAPLQTTKSHARRAMREQAFTLSTLIDHPLDLYRHIPYRLATVVNLLALDRDAAVREVTTLSLSEIRVLLNVGSYMPIRASDVAYQSRLDTYTVSRAVRSLRKRRFIELSHDPSDRRARVLRLTTTGVHYYRRIATLMQARGRALESVLTDAEIDSLYDVLSRLEEKIEAMLATHALKLLKRGRSIAADQRELIRWHKRATSQRLHWGFDDSGP
jgi:DNA-binding MarR family transcriptional regulator